MVDAILNFIAMAATGLLVLYAVFVTRDRQRLNRAVSRNISTLASIHTACAAAGWMIVELPDGSIVMRQVSTSPVSTALMTQSQFRAQLGYSDPQAQTSYDVPEDLSDTERVEKWLSE